MCTNDPIMLYITTSIYVKLTISFCIYHFKYVPYQNISVIVYEYKYNNKVYLVMELEGGYC